MIFTDYNYFNKISSILFYISVKKFKKNEAIKYKKQLLHYKNNKIVLAVALFKSSFYVFHSSNSAIITKLTSI